MKKIEGYEYYWVSEEGFVLSMSDKGVRILKPDRSRGQYYCVTLSRAGRVKRFLIHRLVAEYYIPNPDGKPEVNHKDGNKLNNHVDNLEWVTQSENQLHAFETGLQGRGEKMAGAKKTDAQVHQVCSLIQSGLTRGQVLSLCPFLSKASFNDIRRRRRWHHIHKQYTW